MQSQAFDLIGRTSVVSDWPYSATVRMELADQYKAAMDVIAVALTVKADRTLAVYNQMLHYYFSIAAPTLL